MRGSRRVPDSTEARVEEMREAIKRMNSGKSPDVDGIKVDMLKAGKEVVAEWMTRLTRVGMKEGRAPEEWQEPCVVPIYKRKGERSECKNNREISMLSILGKVAGRVVMERIQRRRNGECERSSVGSEGKECAWVRCLQ